MTHLSHIDPRISLPQRMPVPQLGDDRNRVEPRVLGERGRDDLERLGKRLKAVRLLALEGLAVLREHARNVDLGRAAACDECPVRCAKECAVSVCPLGASIPGRPTSS